MQIKLNQFLSVILIKNEALPVYILKNKTKLLKNNHVSGNIALPYRSERQREGPEFFQNDSKDPMGFKIPAKDMLKYWK